MRLVRCDRCKKEIKLGDTHTFHHVELPILNRDEVSEDEAQYDFCFECLVALWKWLTDGQSAANTRSR